MEYLGIALSGRFLVGGFRLMINGYFDELNDKAGVIDTSVTFFLGGLFEVVSSPMRVSECW